MVRIKWGGSLTGYIVIGIILVGVVTGSVYLVQQRGKQARLAAAPTLVDKQAQGVATSTVSSNSSSQSDGGTTSSGSSSSTTATSTGVSDSTQSQAAPTSAPTALPTTGLELSVSELLGIGLLVMTLMGYFLSRRMLVRSF